MIMISYKCPVCAFSFNESDKAWDDAVAHGACPKCDAQLINFRAPLKISDQARKPRQDIRATYFIESNYKILSKVTIKIGF
jgi:rubredoxin